MKLRFLLLALVCFPYALLAQSAPATGLYAFGSFDNRGFDSINRGNMNPHFSVPIFSKPGRGGTNFFYALEYDGLLWSNQAGAWTPSPTWGWTESTNASWGYVSYNITQTTCTPHNLQPEPATLYSGYTYHDNHGGTHAIPYSYQTPVLQYGQCVTPSAPSSYTYPLTDNSGLTIYQTGNGGGAAFIAFTPGGSSAKVPVAANFVENGQTFQFPSKLGSAVYTDTNGNEISADGSGNFFDTMSSTTAVLAMSGTAPNPTVYTYTDSNGRSENITIAYSSYTVETAFGVTGVSEYPATSAYLISSIAYPDGSAYSFTYEATPGHSGDVTGRISKITLRTGGTISYTFGAMLTDGTVTSLARATTDGTITYTRTSTSGTYTTQVEDATGNYTYLTFLEDSAGHFYESDRKVYTGTNTSGTFLLEAMNCYNDNTTYCTGPNVNNGIGYLNTVVTTGTQGWCCSFNGLYFSDIQQFTGPELPYSDTYAGTRAYNTYTGQYGLSFYRLASITPPGASSAAYLYNYDQTTATPTSGLPQHISMSTRRGNLTSQQIVVSSTQTLTQTNTFDDAGQTLTATDWNNNATSYAYDSSTDTLLTKVTYPKVGSNNAMTAQYSYDPNTGLLLSMTDPNGQVTCYRYDGVMRPTLMIAPDGGQTQETYTGDTQIQQAVLQSGGKGNSSTCTPLSGGQSLTTTATLDSYGRPSLIDQKDASDELLSYTSDANGRVHTVTNPHRSGSSPTDGTTTYAYDGLGNVATITRPDGSQATSTFNQPLPSSPTFNGAVKVVDEANNVKYWVPDQYGRVSDVYEYDPATGANDIQTFYSYDFMGHVVGMTQEGNAASSQWRRRTFNYDLAGRLTSSVTPEEGTISYAYLNSGSALCSGTLTSPCTRTDNASRVTTYGYDSLNRLTGKQYSDGTSAVTYTYDNTAVTLGVTPTNPLGRLTSMVSGSVTSAYSYDSLGRPTSFGSKINGYTKTGAYSYNVDGTLASILYPNGAQVNYGYNSVSQPASVTDVQSGLVFVNNVTYDPAGQLLTMVRNSGSVLFTTTNAYNSMLQPALLSASQPSGTLMSLSYSYNTGHNNGNISTITNNLDSTRTANYQYDQLNRVTQAKTSTWGNGYLYDNWGNLLNKTPISGLTGEASFPSSWTMGTNNQWTPSTGSLYGTAGAMTLDQAGNTYTYNAEGQVTQSGNGSYVTNYTYDGNGQRVIKQSTMANKMYWYGPDGRILNESDTSGNVTDRYGWFNGEMVGRLDSSGPLHFIYHDHLGSTRVVVSAAGTLQDDMDYYPFGTAISKAWTSNNMYQFTGYETDTENNTEHAWFRSHNFSLGRYMKPDPYSGSYNLFDPQSLNRYSYVGNRPLTYTDPLGLSCVTFDNGDMGDDGDGQGCAAAGINPDGSEDGSQSYAYDVYGDPGSEDVTTVDNLNVSLPVAALMFQQSGFFESTIDEKLGQHQGTQLRDNNITCSAHVILNANGDGSTSVSIHYDLFNPFTQAAGPLWMPTGIILHGIADWIPDQLIEDGISSPTGNQVCN